MHITHITDRQWKIFCVRTLQALIHRNTHRKPPLKQTHANQKSSIDVQRNTHRKLLKLVGLSDHIHHKSAELSARQRQRVAIARALVNNPPIIIADETTGNLNTKTGDAIMKIFKDLNKNERTIIMITHDPAIAAHADRIVAVRD